MGRGLVNGISARYKNRVGERFGRLEVIRDVGRDKSNNVLWFCKCDCGETKTISSATLRGGHAKSCGCYQREQRGMSAWKDLSGMRFGKLTVLSQISRETTKKTTWLVRCDCGIEKGVLAASLNSGRTISCGCYSRENISRIKTTHGMSKTPEYKIWAGMIKRCCNPNDKRFMDYGGRGISVCESWRHSFEAFIQDVGPRPSANHSIDRYPNVDGNYEPGNVRWADAIDQARNKRDTRLVSARGECLSLADWCQRLGLRYGTVHSRISKLGWDPLRALGLDDREGTA